MTNRNYVERTHSSVSIEFAAGYGGRLGVLLGLNSDHQTGARSITACVSEGVTLGEVYVKVNEQQSASGGVENLIDVSPNVSVNTFLGAGHAVGFSYDALHDSMDWQSSYPFTDSKTYGVGFGADVSWGACVEFNPGGIANKMAELVKGVFDIANENDEPNHLMSQRTDGQYHLLDPSKIKADMEKIREGFQRSMDSIHEARQGLGDRREPHLGALSEKGIHGRPD